MTLRSLRDRVALLGLLLPLLGGNPAGAQATIEIDATRPGPRVSPGLYGIFVEEINFGVDGGLYGELLRNRAFEDARPPEGCTLKDGRWVDAHGWDSGYAGPGGGLPHWVLVQDGGARGTMNLETGQPLDAATPMSLRLDVEDLGSGRLGVANEGFWGIGIAEGQRYDLSLFARGAAGSGGMLTARLEDASGRPCSEAALIDGIRKEWTRFTVTLTATRTEPQARLVILAGSRGPVWLDLVSLFPRATFKGRVNGMRADIAQMLADLRPAFLRFPGGCIVEGGTLETAYDWKLTVGPLERRPERFGVWNQRRTHGMGFLEYLQLCEDLQCEPLFVAFAGQTCAYRQWEHVPMAGMDAVAASVVDALEYARGPASTPWGARRVADGHPAPFPLRLVEIGNENMGREYEERYAVIYRALKAKAPDVTTLADFRVGSAPVEMVDDHYYNSPEWFFQNHRHYDGYDRKSPPVYVGEYAVTSGGGQGNLQAALAEAAFALGFERNADVVRMASYAPLLCNVHGKNWNPNLINFDGSRVYGTPSYYAQKLLAHHRPDVVLPTTTTAPPAAPMTIEGRIGLGTWETQAAFKDVRIEQEGKVAYAADFAQGAEGWKSEGGAWVVRDGTYRQEARGSGLVAVLDGPTWTDFTLRLKACKTGGDEGFLIVFGDRDGERYWWNVGGWGNREHGIERNRSPVGRRERGSLETGRWYDLQIDVRGRHLRCSLDGRVVHDLDVPAPETLFALAGRDERSGDLIVKAVNASAERRATEIRVQGLEGIRPEAVAWILSSASPGDENSLEAPTRVAPTSAPVNGAGPKFTVELRPHSFTVLRLKTR